MRGSPIPSLYLHHARRVIQSQGENNFPRLNKAWQSPLQKHLMVSDCTGRHHVKILEIRRHCLVMSANDLYRFKIEQPDRFIQKSSLSRILFNQKHFYLRTKDLQWKARETGSRTDVGEPTLSGMNEIRAEKAFSKVSADNFLEIRDGS